MSSITKDYGRKNAPLFGYFIFVVFFIGFFAALFIGGYALLDYEIPKRLEPYDLFLLGAAVYKLSWLITRDAVTSFLRAPFVTYKKTIAYDMFYEVPRGNQLRRSFAEVLICPWCIGMWIVGFFVFGLLAFPEITRLIAGSLAILTISDFLLNLYSYTKMKMSTTAIDDDHKELI